MRPLIVGMNNPQGNPPLWPSPPGCSGWRLWQMIRESHRNSPMLCGLVTSEDYLSAFDRVNLCPTSTWDKPAAVAAAPNIWALMEGRRTVLLGRLVTNCLGYGQPPWMVWRAHTVRDKTDGSWIAIPHPSGVTRNYNSGVFRRQVGDMLLELYLESVGKVR